MSLKRKFGFTGIQRISTCIYSIWRILNFVNINLKFSYVIRLQALQLFKKFTYYNLLLIPTVEKLIGNGLLDGGGKVLKLEHHMLCGLVSNDRAGLYD